MRVFQTIKIYWQKGVSDEQIAFARATIEGILAFAKARNSIKIELGGQISVAPYKSIFRRRVSIDKLEAKGLEFHRSRDVESGYDYAFILVKWPIFDTFDKRKERFLGFASSFKYAIVSTKFSKNIKPEQRPGKLKWVIFHEVGHLFGLISPIRRDELVKVSFVGCRHCHNQNCVMYPYYNNFAEVDFNMPFCAVCLLELRDNLRDYSSFRSE